jgi:diguanylate cyclase (GGDEF)-like protein
VDCFDALTSDRPYRPRLSDEDALAILRQRRGTMYDPVIVDTFFKVHAKAPKEPERTGPPSEVLNTITNSRRTLPERTAAADSADRVLTLHPLARALAGQASMDETAEVIAKHLQLLIPSALCVFYLYDADVDELEARYALGIGATSIKGMRVTLGQRLSGWVAANRQTISNSDAALDLGDRGLGTKLRSCISTPLVAQDNLIGVLTLYSTEISGFEDEHRRIIEATSRQIASAFRTAETFDAPAGKIGSLAGLPYLNQLQQFLDGTGSHHLDQGSAVRLVLIRAVELERITRVYGRNAKDDVLKHVMHHAASCLRSADILFRNGGDEFVALLNDTTDGTAVAVSHRIRDGIRRNPFILRDDIAINVDVSVETVSAVGDYGSLARLIDDARARDRRMSASLVRAAVPVAGTVES